MDPETDHAYVDIDLWQKWYCRARKNGAGEIGYLYEKQKKERNLTFTSYHTQKSNPDTLCI